jgi:hypothetical protein
MGIICCYREHPTPVIEYTQFILRIWREASQMSDLIESVREADKQNFYDQTEDVVKAVPATTDVDEAVEAITAHINKYDIPEEEEKK